MPNKDYTALVLVVDRSGSMESIQRDMLRGIRGIRDDLIKDVKANGGKVTVDVFQFDNYIDHIEKSTKIEDFEPRLEPRGGTALYDAIVKAASDSRDAFDLLADDKQPGKVQVVVVTDGEENSSRTADAQLVSDTVNWTTDNLGWDWAFLGANQDAVYVGATLGFEGKKSMTFASTAAGVSGTSSSLSDYIAQTRRGEDASFSDDHRKAALGH